MGQSNQGALVTIVMPAYNHERYILESLEGIASQTYKNLQWIIADDCSKDNTRQILKDNQEKYGYELILNEKNLGIAASLNNMIKNHAKGKFICICASDDVYMPNKIERLVDAMESHSSYGMCYSRSIFIDENSKEIRRDETPDYRSGYIFEDILCRKYHIGACNLMRKSILEEFGYYPNGIIAEDFYMNCKIAEKYEIGFVDEYLMKYRLVAVGKKRDPYALYKSHEDTIRLFQHTPIYKEAILLQYLCYFVALSRYKKYKILSLKYAVLCLPMCYKIDFLKALVRFVVKWESFVS